MQIFLSSKYSLIANELIHFNTISSSKIINYALIFVWVFLMILITGWMICMAFICFEAIFSERKYIKSDPLIYFHTFILGFMCLIGIFFLPMMTAKLLLIINM